MNEDHTRPNQKNSGSCITGLLGVGKQYMEILLKTVVLMTRGNSTGLGFLRLL